MDYEKKYKEALERARTMLTNDVAADIFPELTESENERIRKAIIGHFKTGTEYVSFSGFSKGEIINWLEKQGEYTPIVMIPKFRVGDVIRPKGSTAEYAIESISGECYHGKGWGLHISGDNDYELVKQNNAWSEEDKKLIDDTCHLINTLASGYGERVTEPITLSGTQMIASIKDRLRALVDNRPQNTWKPSDEQMKILNEVLNFAANHEGPHWNIYIFGTLNNLIRQLKNLREE